MHSANNFHKTYTTYFCHGLRTKSVTERLDFCQPDFMYHLVTPWCCMPLTRAVSLSLKTQSHIALCTRPYGALLAEHADPPPLCCSVCWPLFFKWRPSLLLLHTGQWLRSALCPSGWHVSAFWDPTQLCRQVVHELSMRHGHWPWRQTQLFMQNRAVGWCYINEMVQQCSVPPVGPLVHRIILKELVRDIHPPSPMKLQSITQGGAVMPFLSHFPVSLCMFQLTLSVKGSVYRWGHDTPPSTSQTTGPAVWSTRLNPRDSVMSAHLFLV